MQPIQTETHFTDLIDTPHLFNDKDRLPDGDGNVGKGMKLEQAVRNSEIWWDTVARYLCPDYGKDPHTQVVRSGILMGLPWDNLDKQEKLRVLAQWYAHVGVHLILAQMDSGKIPSSNIDELRMQGVKMFSVLGNEGTHAPVNPEVEEEVWKEGYDEIAAENIVNSKGKYNGNEEDH